MSAKPTYNDKGVPYCTERCPEHDGKRCEILGHAPSTICEPAVAEMAAKLNPPKEQPKRELKHPNRPDTSVCPICKAEVVGRCKCMRGDAHCRNGHKWHVCPVHDRVVMGESDHSKPMNTCTCKNLCPTCLEPAITTCRCFRQDSTCKNGHQWHTCTVHNMPVLGHSDHSIDTMTCTCGRGEANERKG